MQRDLLDRKIKSAEEKDLKKARAFKLKKERRKRTPEEQLELLNQRPGGAVKERRVLENLIFARDLFRSNGDKDKSKKGTLYYTFKDHDKSCESLKERFKCFQHKKSGEVLIEIKDEKLFHCI